MPAFHRRFVGATSLPKSLTGSEVAQCFAQSSDHVEAIRNRFTSAKRLGAALQLVILKATGRSLQQVAGLPRSRLANIASALGLSAPSARGRSRIGGHHRAARSDRWSAVGGSQLDLPKSRRPTDPSWSAGAGTANAGQRAELDD